MAFIMGLMVYLPGTFQDYAMAVPFMPVSVVLFGAALVTKLYFDADESRTAFRVVTALVFGGAASWIFGTVFVTESPIQLASLPSGVSSSGGIWYTISSTFSSQSNVDLSMLTFNVCFAALGVIGLFGLAHPFLHSRMGKPTPKIAQNQGPVSPTGLPGRSYPGQQAQTGPSQNAASSSVQASNAFLKDGIDYIQ